VFREEVRNVRVDRVQEIVSTELLEDTELALADRVHEKPREAAEERERVSMVGTWQRPERAKEEDKAPSH
jgi:hypothetical protein